jgi:hypothetical protein
MVPTDAGVMFGSVLLVCTFCLGLKHMVLLLAGFGVLAALSVLVLRPLHLGWIFPLVVVAGSWTWITVRVVGGR